MGTRKSRIYETFAGEKQPSGVGTVRACTNGNGKREL